MIYDCEIKLYHLGGEYWVPAQIYKKSHNGYHVTFYDDVDEQIKTRYMHKNRVKLTK